jgi:hypothetical protein
MLITTKGAVAAVEHRSQLHMEVLEVEAAA